MKQRNDWLTPKFISMQNYSGDGSVALGVFPCYLTSWNLDPSQHPSGDDSASNKFNRSNLRLNYAS